MTDLLPQVELTARVRELGDRLRQHRLNAQLTGQKLAAEASISQPKISKIESGKVLPSRGDIERIALALRLPEAELHDLVEKATVLSEYSRSWRAIHGTGLAGAQREAHFTEQLASLVRFFQPNLIPGLLQYRQYAREVLLRANVTGQIDVDEAVNIRMERQDQLHSSDKEFRFVILETALHQRYCTVEVMQIQLDLLSSLSRLPNVSLGIVADTTVLPRLPLNGFGIFDENTVAIETMHGETVLNDVAGVQFYDEVFHDFERVAEYGEAAAIVIERARSSLR